MKFELTYTDKRGGYHCHVSPDAEYIFKVFKRCTVKSDPAIKATFDSGEVEIVAGITVHGCKFWDNDLFPQFMA